MKKLFRRRFFGGYHKQDVDACFSSLEDEIAALKEELKQKNDSPKEDRKLEEVIEENKKLIGELETVKDSNSVMEKQLISLRNAENTIAAAHNSECQEKLERENERLKSEIKELLRISNQETDERSMVIRVLREAKENAEIILADANKSAEQIIQQAEKEAEEKRVLAYQKLQKEMEKKLLDLITAKYRISDYMKEIEKVEGELSGLVRELKTVSENIPTKAEDILAEPKNDKILETSYSVVSVEEEQDTQEQKQTENIKGTEEKETGQKIGESEATQESKKE